MAINATDRVIRLYELSSDKPPKLMHKFQDLVNRIQWSRCQFSCDGEYVVGGSSQDHNIYIWDKNMGSLVKILEGPNESLEDLMVSGRDAVLRVVSPDLVASIPSYRRIRFVLRTDLHLGQELPGELERIRSGFHRVGRECGV